MRAIIMFSTVLLCSSSLIRKVCAAGGLDSSTSSEICSQTLAEIQKLLINPEQDENGVTGHTVVASDCKILVDADVMDVRSDEDQKALCGNSCYDSLNTKYKIMLDNDCYASEDADEEASAKLQAAAYQIACQTNADEKYCSKCGFVVAVVLIPMFLLSVPLLGTLVKDAGTSFSLCDDIVSKLGCCFQSYRQYMLLGTSVSVNVMDEAQKACTADGVGGLDQMCPCSYNQHALASTTFCSRT
ncbi:hypothetical protein DVH05_022534 [Phytophthora capsici]|nr:hypothetical protein DVH05_022534 [Phytophthora capsici]